MIQSNVEKAKKLKPRVFIEIQYAQVTDRGVKVSGLRWLSMMLLVEITWAQRVWALPFLTVLAPSERYSQQHKCRHKTLIDWAR